MIDINIPEKEECIYEDSEIDFKEYEDSIQATEPEKFLKLSCDYYKNKIIK